MKAKALFFLLGAIIATIAFFVIQHTEFTAIAQNTDTGDTTSSESQITDGFEGLFDSKSSPENYIKNGNFYSSEKPRRLPIDISYVDEVDTAVWWYDKVLNEYPGTAHAQDALHQKIRTLVGWSDGYGDDKEYFGLYDRKKGAKYFPLIESSFLELETGYPDDLYLEAFAFQIAQRYLYHVFVYKKKSWRTNCIEWFEKTIELANGKDTFYSHLSKNALNLLNNE